MMFSLLIQFGLSVAQIVNPVAAGVDTVDQSSGYFDVAHGKIFFWMFASRHNPNNAPVIFWFSGGPGAASMPSLLYENGPVMLKDGKLNYNKYSWNEFANVVYIDQPVGTGFSTVHDEYSYCNNTNDAAVDIVEFVDKFYQQYPNLLQNDLHLAGESYAGRFVPTFAHALMSAPNKVKSIKSILLGDAQVDKVAAVKANIDVFCPSSKPLVPKSACDSVKKLLPTCEKTANECSKTQDSDTCFYAIANCSTGELFGSYAQSGLSPYHIGDKCQPAPFNLCLKAPVDAMNWLNQAKVKSTIGVANGTNADMISQNVVDNWDNGDEFYKTSLNVTELINWGVEVLVYTGSDDGAVPFESSVDWTSKLHWWGQFGFKSSLKAPSDWCVEGHHAGTVSSFGPLTLLKVFGAGHILPYDTPAAAYKLAKQWVELGMIA